MSFSEQLKSLRMEQGRLTTAIKDAGERISQRLSALEHKLSLAGEPDPDIQADIDFLRASVDAISRIGGDAEQVAGEVGAIDSAAVAAEDAAAESGKTEVHEAGGESTVGSETVESEVAVTTTPADEAAEESEDESADEVDTSAFRSRRF